MDQQLPDDSSFNPNYNYNNNNSVSNGTTRRVTSFPNNSFSTGASQSQTSFPAPSHEYGLYRQQTGIVPGALEETLSMNQSNTPLLNYDDFPYLFHDTVEDDFFDFNTASSQVSGTYVSPSRLSSISESNFVFGATIDPNFIGGQEPDTLTPPSAPPAPTTSSIGQLRPGMHTLAAQQAALAQQQMLPQQQALVPQHQQMLARQGALSQSPAMAPAPAQNPTEQKISRVVEAIHCEPPAVPLITTVPLDLPKLKKAYEEMDEDEKLLASENAKKMPTGAKRRIRNKVSARNFRERRKRYIEGLEQELIKHANENALYKAKNAAMEDENKRLMNLTKMLLSSPHFAPILNDLSNNPQQIVNMGSSSTVQHAPQGHQLGQQRPSATQYPHAQQQAQLHSV